MKDLISEFYKAIALYEKLNIDTPQHKLLNIKLIKEMLPNLQIPEVNGDVALALDTTGFKVYKVNNFENPPHPMSFFHPYKKYYLQLCYSLETSYLPIEQWCLENNLTLLNSIEDNFSKYRQGKYIDDRFCMPIMQTLPNFTTYCRFIFDDECPTIKKFFPEVQNCNEITCEATANDDEVVVRFNNQLHYREDVALFRFVIDRKTYNKLIHSLTNSPAAKLETLDSIVVFRYDTNHWTLLTDDWKRALITQIVD